MDKYSKQINNYLFNEMNELQKENFEALMKSDVELGAEVKRQVALLEAIHGRMVYKEAMDDPNVAELDQLAKEAVQDRGLPTPTIKRISTARIIYKLVASSTIFILVKMPNNITFGKTRLEKIYIKTIKNLDYYGKMLWERLKNFFSS